MSSINVIDELRRTAGRRRRHAVRRLRLFDAHLAQARQAGAVQSDADRHRRRRSASRTQQFAAGRFGEEPMSRPQVFTYSVTTPGRLADRTQFEDIIIRSEENGGALRLKDVARVELGALIYGFSGTFNGSPAVPIGVYLQPGANALQVGQDVKATMDRLAKRFPEGLRYDIPFDTTALRRGLDRGGRPHLHRGDRAGRRWWSSCSCRAVRATLIPVIAVPVSIIGTFAGMYVLGFSINLLTLFGLVLAIGIVVDDAIVVLENVERIMRRERQGAARGRHRRPWSEVTGRSSPSCWCCARCSCRCRSWAASRASSTASSP